MASAGLTFEYRSENKVYTFIWSSVYKAVFQLGESGFKLFVIMFARTWNNQSYQKVDFVMSRFEEASQIYLFYV